MKRIRLILIAALLLLVINYNAFSQSDAQSSKTTILEPYPLAITLNKTTNLIFPFSIKSVDRGSRDVLAQKAMGVENILLLKAGRENFTETNLSVITSDGKLYSFILNYSRNPALLNIYFKEDSSSKDVRLIQDGTDEGLMKLSSEWIVGKKNILHAVHDYKYKIDFRLNGMYVRDDIFFFQFVIKNRSNINYYIDILRFCIQDKQKAKRGAWQELELRPLYVHGDLAVIKGQSKNALVFALPKFTIPDDKYFYVQLMEKSGGRHLRLRIPNRVIIKAKTLEQ